MKQTIDLYQFRRAFEAYGRTDFSYGGLEVLFDYLEHLEEDLGEAIDLDAIALCCEYSEDTFAEAASNYSIDVADCEDDQAVRDEVLDYLANNTSVCGTTDTHVVYQSF